jgi:hypothetical protein
VAGSPSEHAAQPQRNEGRYHREKQDVDVLKPLGHYRPHNAPVAAADEFPDLAADAAAAT